MRRRWVLSIVLGGLPILLPLLFLSLFPLTDGFQKYTANEGEKDFLFTLTITADGFSGVDLILPRGVNPSAPRLEVRSSNRILLPPMSPVRYGEVDRMTRKERIAEYRWDPVSIGRGERIFILLHAKEGASWSPKVNSFRPRYQAGPLVTIKSILSRADMWEYVGSSYLLILLFGVIVAIGVLFSAVVRIVLSEEECL